MAHELLGSVTIDGKVYAVREADVKAKLSPAALRKRAVLGPFDTPAEAEAAIRSRSSREDRIAGLGPERQADIPQAGTGVSTMPRFADTDVVPKATAATPAAPAVPGTQPSQAGPPQFKDEVISPRIAAAPVRETRGEFGTAAEKVDELKAQLIKSAKLTQEGGQIAGAVENIKSALKIAGFTGEVSEAAITGGKGYRQWLREMGVPDNGTPFSLAAIASLLMNATTDPTTWVGVGAVSKAFKGLGGLRALLQRGAARGAPGVAQVIGEAAVPGLTSVGREAAEKVVARGLPVTKPVAQTAAATKRKGAGFIPEPTPAGVGFVEETAQAAATKAKVKLTAQQFLIAEKMVAAGVPYEKAAAHASSLPPGSVFGSRATGTNPHALEIMAGRRQPSAPKPVTKVPVEALRDPVAEQAFPNMLREGETALINATSPKDAPLLDEAGAVQWVKLPGAVKELIGLSRFLKTGFDLGATLIQMPYAGTRFPLQFARSLWTSLRVAASKPGYLVMKGNIENHPKYQQAVKWGVDMTAFAGRDLDKMEDTVASNLFEVASDWLQSKGRPGKFVDVFIGGTQRAFAGGLTDFRFRLFDTITDQMTRAGVELDDKAGRALARYVNAVTGRGDLGKVGKFSDVLSLTLFSPKRVASVFNLVDPRNYITAHPFVRKQFLKNLFSSATVTATAMGAAKLRGSRVGDDPTSSDYGKVVDEDGTRYEIVPGNIRPYVVLAAQLYRGETTSVSGHKKFIGQKFGGTSRKEMLLRFLRTKESPIAGFIDGWLSGEDFRGRPFNAPAEAIDLFIPMVIENILELVSSGELTLKRGVVASLQTLGASIRQYGGESPPTVGERAVQGLREKGILR